MMKTLFCILILLLSSFKVHALVVNEIMSNPVGDDSGREWFEIYNETDNDIDISGLTVSIKGGAPIPVSSVNGGVILMHKSYAIVASTVSGGTKFLQDYGAYSGPLLKANISLVNSGNTSLQLKLGGIDYPVVTYTAAKEGQTYSYFDSGYGAGTPSPGEVNKVVTVSEDTTQAISTQVGNQVSVSAQLPPSEDITLFLPLERVVVAGMPNTYSVFATTKNGRELNNMLYDWSFGDGGAKSGASTTYTYYYPGVYVAQVEGYNGVTRGVAREQVRVVAPDISVSSIKQGKYGAYIELTNPNSYDLDISTWRLVIDLVEFPFPKNTILAPGVTKITGQALGFASTTFASSSVIKIIFPTREAIAFVTQDIIFSTSKIAETTKISSLSNVTKRKEGARELQIKNDSRSGTEKKVTVASMVNSYQVKQRDKGIADLLKSLFK